MFHLANDLKELIDGDVETDASVLEKYSKDTSLFQVMPEVVVFPKHSADVEKIISYVREHKKDRPGLSITGRSAGTDMTGGPLNESIIMVFTKYFTNYSVDIGALSATVEPGVYYHDFETKTLPADITFPPYPASKSIAALGGMIMNNSGGEKTLRYGQARNFIDELSMVLSDGKEYTFKKITADELEEKKSQENFEGEVYRKMHDLLEKNYDLVKAAKPHTSKNSAGYDLWDIWDRQTFDMTQLFTGSQGTLGVLTNARVRLVKEKPHRRMIALFFKSWDNLPDVVNALLPFDPESLEAFDDTTLKLGLRFMPEIAKKAHTTFLKFFLKFLPETWIGIKMLGLPKLIVLAEFSEDEEFVLEQKLADAEAVLEKHDVEVSVLKTEEDSEKYVVMRHESFNLLREHVKGKRTAPFIDDFCIDPNKIPEFLPKVLSILKEYGIKANIAGHAGNGNFHIIPLMDLTLKKEREKIPVVAQKIYDLVIEYKGSITAEHNDGIMRTPFLEEMYGSEVYDLFEEVKNIFDPQNIFNPGKKVGGSMEYLKKHISAS